MSLRSNLPWLVHLSLCLTLGLSASATAQASELQIEWAANTPCEAPPSLARDVEQLLGHAGQPPAGWRFVVQVRDRATDVGAALKLTLRVFTPTSQRQRVIDVESCEQATRTAAVLIAVAIDPTVATVVTPEPTAVETPGTTTAVTPAAVAAALVAPAATPTDDDAPRQADAATQLAPPASNRGGIGAIVGLDIARLPHLTSELTLRAVIRGPWWRGELLGSWLAPRALSLPERDNAKLDLWAVSAATRGCVLTTLWRVHMGPCAIARVGWIRASSAGVDNNLPQNTWLWSAGLAGVAEWSLTKSLMLDLLWGGEMSLVRPTFRVRGSRASHTLPLLSTQVGLGLWVRFG